MRGSGTRPGVEYDFLIGDGVRIWLAIENADLVDVDDELDDSNDMLDSPDTPRGNILRVDSCPTGVFGVECDPTQVVPFASCVVSSIK